MARWSRAAGRCCLVVAATLVALAAAEAVLRIRGAVTGEDVRLYQRELLSPDRLPQPLLMPSPLLGTELRVNTQVLATTSDFSVVYTVNSRGLRDAEHPYERRPEAVRILALGDSFTFGEGVPYGARFVDVAESAFPNLEMVTAAVPGWGIDQELVYLAVEGNHYAPDYVFFFYTSPQAGRYSLPIIADGRVHLPTRGSTMAVQLGPQYVRASSATAAGDAWWHASFLLSYLEYAVQRHRLEARFAAADEAIWFGPATRAGSSAGDAGVSLNERRILMLLAEAGRLGRAHGFGVVVIDISSPQGHPLPASLPAGVRRVSFVEMLRRAGEQQPLIFRYDRHYNPKTHALIAEALIELLRSEIDGLLVENGRLRRVASSIDKGPPPTEAFTESGADPIAETAERAQALVHDAFHRLLHRPANASEAGLWTSRLKADRRARAGLIAELLEGEEYRRLWQPELFVLSMYLGIFNRFPDQPGFDHWVGELRAERVSPRDMLLKWIVSDEWRDKLGSLSNAQIVARLGRGILGRSVTDDEVTRWLETLDDAQGKEATARLILDILHTTDEHRLGMRLRLLPAQVLLAGDGNVSESEYEYWLGRLELGDRRERVIDELVEKSWAAASPR